MKNHSTWPVTATISWALAVQARSAKQQFVDWLPPSSPLDDLEDRGSTSNPRPIGQGNNIESDGRFMSNQVLIDCLRDGHMAGFFPNKP